MTAFIDPTQKQGAPVFIVDRTPEDIALDNLELLIGEHLALDAWPVHSKTALQLISDVQSTRRRRALSERLDAILDRQDRFIAEYKSSLAAELVRKLTAVMENINA